MAAPTGSLLALLSALPLVAFGAFLFFLKPRRRDQTFFAAFAVLWGLQIGFANIGNVLESTRIHRVTLLIDYALLPVATLFLVHFVTLVRPFRRAWLLSASALALSAVAAAVLLLDPRSVVARVEGDPAPTLTVLGPAALPLFIAPFFLAFYLAIVVLYAQYRRAPAGSPRHRVRGVLLALALFTSYQSVRQLERLAFPGASTRASDWVSSLGLPFLFALGTVLLAGVAIHLALRPPPPGGQDTALLLAFVVPAATAIIEIGLDASEVPLESVGFWRFAAVASLVYTLAHHQLFDLDLKLKRFAGPGVAGILLAFGIPVALSLASSTGPAVIASAIVVEAVGVGASLVFQDRIKEALFPGVEPTNDYVYQRKLEVYRASLEDAHARGIDPESAELRELRLRLGVSDRDHRVLTLVLAPTATTAASVGAKIGAVVLGRYKLERLLGSGTHGRTFVAADKDTRRKVAVKIVGRQVLGGGAALALLREARLGASIAHPHVVQILDVAETTDEVILVMEFADGGNLQQLIDRAGTPPPTRAFAIADQMLAALEAVHAKGLIHRNLKPVNILLTESGDVKLSDFGSARTQTSEATTSDDVHGASMSLLHMSPEQVRGRPSDARSDLYQVAIVLYEILTDKTVYAIGGKDDFQIRQLIVEATPELHLPASVAAAESVLRKALAKEPEERYPDARSMRAALKAVAPP